MKKWMPSMVVDTNIPVPPITSRTTRPTMSTVMVLIMKKFGFSL